MAIAGLRGTGSFGADERPKSFREMILFRRPNGDAPVFALSARASAETVSDPEHSWYDESLDIVRLTTSAALDTTETLVEVSGTDPDAANPDRVYGSAEHLVPGDLLLVETNAFGSTFAPEILEVVQVLSPTQFVAKRGAAGTTAANIASGAGLLKIGSVFSEGESAPLSATRNPIKFSNFAQIFKTSYQVTKTAAVTRYRTGDPVKNDKRRKAFDHSRDIEFAMLFGVKSEVIGPNGQPKRTMGGIRSFLPASHVTSLTSGWTINDLLDAVDPVFAFTSEAGDERIVFAGSGALNSFNKVIQSSTADLNFDGLATVYGMNFRRFVIPQGSLFIKTHPLMSRHPVLTNAMFILDFSAIKWRPLPNRDTKAIDNVQAKDEDVIRGFWLTEATIEVLGGGLTMGYISNVVA